MAFYKSFNLLDNSGLDPELSTCVLPGLVQRLRLPSSSDWFWFWLAPLRGLVRRLSKLPAACTPDNPFPTQGSPLVSLASGGLWVGRSLQSKSSGGPLNRGYSHRLTIGSHAAFEALRRNRARHSCWNFAPAPSILRCPQCWASGVSETRCSRPASAKASNETKPSFAKAIICFASAGRATLAEIAPI